MGAHRGTDSPPRRLRFGVFELDTEAEELYHGETRVQIQEMPVRVLELLLERPGELVRREEFFHRLWPDDELGILDDNLNVAVWKLRAALKDTADHPRFIETVPRKGYRFIAPVEALGPDPRGPAADTGESDGPPAPWKSRPRRIGIGIAALIAFLAATFAWMTPTGPEREEALEAPAADSYTVAVLPFANLSGNTDNEYFSDGITEDLLTHLSRVPDFRVISRASVMRFKDTDKSIREIGEELGATHILEGSVRRQDGRVRITAQLVDARADYHLWAENYDRDLEDIFAIQSEIATMVTDALRAALPGGKRADSGVRVKPTDDLNAYQAYLQGRYHFHNYIRLGGAAGLQKSLGYYREALEHDPDFARALAAEAASYALLAVTTFNREAAVYEPEEANERALDAASKALALDPKLAEAHTARAFVHIAGLQWNDAQRSLERALEIEPNEPQSLLRLGIMLVSVGKSEQARAVLQAATELDPLNPVTAHWLADALRNTGRLEDSSVQAQRSVDLGMSASGIGVYINLLTQDRWEDAITYQEGIFEKQGINPAFVRPLVEAVQNPDRIPEAVAITELVSGTRSELTPIFYYFDLADPDLIFDRIDELVERDMGLYAFWRIWEPKHTHLRNHPRFHELAERVGLVDYWRKTGWPDLCRPAERGFTCG